MQAADLLFRGFALFKSGKYREAVDFFRLLTLTAPTEGRFWVTLGHALRRADEKDEAIEAYKTALLLGQDKDPETLLCLAELLKDSRQDEEAKILIQEAQTLAQPAFKKQLEHIEKTWFTHNTKEAVCGG